MPTILTKKSDTPGAVPATANLTNAAGGAELAVNTADKRLFTINSSSAVVELGTNPGSLTCADASFTVARISSGTVTQLTSTSATVTTLTATSASVTNLTATSIVISNLSIASANITTLTSTNATAASLTVSTGNLTFSGTAQRITGDMSNATIANRLAFQTSTTNGNTDLNIIPNGTSVTSGIRLNNNSDTTDAGYVRMSLNSTEAGISVDRNSVSGTYLPLGFNTGGSERMRLDTSGRELIGLTDAATVGGVNNSALQIFGGGAARINVMRGDANANSPAVFLSKSRSTSSGTFSALQSGDGCGAVSFYGDDGSSLGTNVARIEAFVDGAVSGSTVPGRLVFSTNQGSSTASATERMRIDSSGNVGIGTASPNKRFSVISGGSTQFTIETTAGANDIIKFDTYNASAVNGVYTWSQQGSERMRIDSSGNVGIGGTGEARTKVTVTGTLPTSGTQSFGFNVTGTIPSGTTSGGYGYSTGINTEAASFTLTELRHYNASQATIGAGSTVTNQYGFIVNSNLTGATNNYGFYSNIASGSNRWNFYANGTAANYFAGDTGIGRTPAASTRFTVKSSDNGSGTFAVYVENSTPTEMFKIRDDGTFYTGLAGNSPYNLTTGSAANVFVDSDGILRRSTSSLRYKSDVADADHGLSDVLKLRSVTYSGKNDGDKTFGGLIAEEVHDAGLTEFVAYDKEGRPDALHYGNMVALLVKAVQELKAELDALKAA